MLGTAQRWIDRRRLTDASYGFLFEPNASDEVVCIDTETSGLDPSTAQLLSIAALRIKGNRVQTANALELLIRPQHPVDVESIKVHHLRERDLSQGLPVRRALHQFLHFCGARPLVGYYLEFDVAMINKYVRPWLGVRMPNRRIEISGIYHDKKIGLIPRRSVDLRFDSMREELGIPALGKHDAYNDALMSALMYVKLQNLN